LKVYRRYDRGCIRDTDQAMTLRALAAAGAVVLSTAVMAGETGGGRQPTVLTLGQVRALVISPHPDDATLGAGGLIQRVMHEGGAVRVVEMTGGDAFPG